MKLANKIKDIASKHNLSVTDIADRLGVAQSQISRTINNERINLKDLEVIAGIIGCEVGEFFIDEQLPSDSLKCPYCGHQIDITIK